MVKVGMLQNSFCDTCTKCPRCGKPGAKIDRVYGILNCLDCQIELNKLSKPLNKKYASFTSKEEFYATPFYKHMGLPLKPHEKRQEKEMKRRGLSYLDLQRERNKDAKPNPQMRKVAELALKGELVNHVKKINDNRRERVVGKSSQKIL